MANLQLNSTLTLYQVPFSPEDNFLLDKPLEYLESLTPIYSIDDFQFVYPGLNKTIKVRLSPSGTPYISALYARPNMNYAMIAATNHPTEGGGTVNRALYFIKTVTWVDTDTVTLTLEMDTLNMLVISMPQRNSQNIPWEDHTHISRQHKDRFKKLTGTSKYIPVIDYMSEGITVSKLKSNESEITDTFGKWYVIYKTKYDVGSEGSNPVSINLVPAGSFTVTRSLSTLGNVELGAGDFEVGYYYYFLSDDNFGASINNLDTSSPVNTIGQSLSGGGYLVGYRLHLREDGQIVTTQIHGDSPRYKTSTSITYAAQSLYMRKAYFRTINFGYIRNQDTAPSWDLFESQILQKYYVGGESAPLISVDELDRSSPRLLKIVEYPYLPVDLTISASHVITPGSNMSYVGGYLRYVPGTDEHRLIKQVMISRIESVVNKAAPNMPVMVSYHEEPKILHSDYTIVKFVFDSFSYDLSIERLTLLSSSEVNFNKSRSFDVSIYPSFNISNSYLFSVASDYIEPIGDYDGFIAVKRNNEVSLYNSEYLNYMRLGYNYDLKSKTLQEGAQIASTVISAIGTIASFASAAYTGGAGVAAGVALATTFASSTVGLAKSISSNEISMASKLASLQNQSVNVSGADDLDLLHTYCPNLKIEIYTPAVYEERRIIDHLRLHGYACDEYGVPYTHTRLYYNYVQCDAEFVWESVKMLNREVLADCKRRFSEGVTFLHAVDNGYDFQRRYENWENTLLN